MKLTKAKLKKIIQEELESSLIDEEEVEVQEEADMWDIDLEDGWATLISDQDPDDFGGDYPSVKIVPVPGSGDRYTLIWGVRAPDYHAVIDEKGDLRPIGRYIPAGLIQKVLKRFAAKNQIEP